LNEARTVSSALRTDLRALPAAGGLRRLALALALAAAPLATGCKEASLGTCANNSDCPSGATCDQSQSPAVCVIPASGCTPLCSGGAVCVAGACVAPDGGAHDAGPDAGADAGHDAGPDAGSDGGTDGGADAGHDAGTDGGSTDTTGPVIDVVTDGRATLYGGGAVVAITVNITDPGGSGTTGTTAKLLVAGHAAFTATVGAGGVTNFVVTLDDALAPAGQNSQVFFSIEGRDLAGNVTTLGVGATPKAVIRVDRAPPTGTIDPVAGWHTQVETLTVTGTVADPGGLLGGGKTSVTILHGATEVGSGTVTATTSTTGTWTAQVDLSAQTIPAAEGPWAFTARLTDASGNQGTVSGGSAQIDAVGPQFGAINLLSSDDYTQPDGGHLFKSDGGVLAFTALVTDVSGVAAVCAKYAGEASLPDGGCPHAATPGAANVWSFSLPRPGSAAPLTGGTPTNWTLSAEDNLTAGLPAGAKAAHQSQTAGDPLFFDNQGPAIAIAADPTWYGRVLSDGGAPLANVVITPTDPAGILGGNSPNRPSIDAGPGGFSYCTPSGNNWTCPVDLTLAQAGAEGDLTYAVIARDHLGTQGQATGALHVDAKPPVLSGLRIYRDAPGAGTVAYPAATAGTGWDGGSYIYDDVVHVAGTLTDNGAGVSGARARLRIDGQEWDGGTPKGADVPLNCTSGPSCPFDVQVALNAAGNGPLHPGAGGAAGVLKVVISSEDRAVAPDGSPAPQAGSSSPTSLAVSRLRWFFDLPGLQILRGLVVHPSGDVIATGEAASNKDSVLSLKSAGPTAQGGALNWTCCTTAAGTDASFGNVYDAPAVGAGDATHALIYAASASGQSGATGAVAAINPSGTLRWLAPGTDAFLTAPLVVSGTKSGNAFEGVVIPSSSSATNKRLYVFTPGTAAGTASSANASASSGDDNSAPMALNGTVYWGVTDRVLTQVLNADGTFGAQARILNGSTGPYWSPLTDGTNVWIPEFNVAPANNNNGGLWWVNGSGTAASLPQQPSAQATDVSLDALGNLWFSSLSTGRLYRINGTSTSNTRVTVYDPGSGSLAAYSPLQGADGRTYDGRRGKLFNVFGLDGSTEWSWVPPLPLLRFTALDCQGHLYVGVGNSSGAVTAQTVYSFVADDHGLADSGWPKYRRDGRNTGNASALKYGIHTAQGCTQ
jgi:hypothetical protein